MKEVICRKCGGKWDEPDMLNDTVFEQSSEMFRTNKTVEGIAYLRTNTGITIKGAKGIYLHTTRKRGICHKCNKPLEANKKTECKNCGSINYDW